MKKLITSYFICFMFLFTVDARAEICDASYGLYDFQYVEILDDKVKCGYMFCILDWGPCDYRSYFIRGKFKPGSGRWVASGTLCGFDFRGSDKCPFYPREFG